MWAKEFNFAVIYRLWDRILPRRWSTSTIYTMYIFDISVCNNLNNYLDLPKKKYISLLNITLPTIDTDQSYWKCIFSSGAHWNIIHIFILLLIFLLFMLIVTPWTDCHHPSHLDRMRHCWRTSYEPCETLRSWQIWYKMTILYYEVFSTMR